MFFYRATQASILDDACNIERPMGLTPFCQWFGKPLAKRRARPMEVGRFLTAAKEQDAMSVLGTLLRSRHRTI